MNLRILKKLSKRAAQHMESLGFTQKHFPAGRGDGYTETYGHDRKHWERIRARYPGEPRRGDIHIKPRRGEGLIVLSEQYIYPWPGTVMLGWSVGYYEPEWEENDVWSLLKQSVQGHWEEYREVLGSEDENGCPEFEWVIHRRFRNPAAILRALPEVIEARRTAEEKRKAQRDAITTTAARQEGGKV